MSNAFEFHGNSASSNARQHNGNIYGNVTNNYAAPIIRHQDDSSRELALLEACQKGQAKRVERLLKLDLDLDFVEPEGRTALHFSASGGRLDIVKLLVNADCDLDISSPKHGTALCGAAREGHTPTIEFLSASGADLNAPGGWHGSALHAACLSGHLEAADLLLKSGADINATRVVTKPDESHSGLLYHYTSCQAFYAAVESGHSALIPLLARHGADVNVNARNWSTAEPQSTCTDINSEHQGEVAAIHHAVISQDITALQSLLEVKASIEAQDEQGRTPLMLAAQRGVLQLLQVLMDAGAFVNSRDQRGWTALDHAAAEKYSSRHANCRETLVGRGAIKGAFVNGQISVAAQYGKLDRLKDLVSKTTINTNIAGGRTALHIAASEGQTKCVLFLLSEGADVNATDNEKRTPLFNAKSQQCMEALIRAGADLHYADKYGWTPLLRHADSGEDALTAISTLLEFGADVDDHFPTTGDTAFTMAKKRGYQKMMDLLHDAAQGRTQAADHS